MKIVVALGNIGDKYKKTRHNAGFMFVEYLLGEESLWELDKKNDASVCFFNNTYFVKPYTLMNNSGLAVRAFIDYYKLLPKKLGLFGVKDVDLTNNLLVIHDELDIDLGKYKNSVNVSSAGHNGVESIIRHLKTKNFRRLRIGISNDQRKHIPGDKFVLQKFSSEEISLLESVFLDIKNKGDYIF